MYIHVNGELIPKEEAHISPFDHGYLYGIGLFETIRVYNRHPFLLDDHIERLNKGLQMIRINFECSTDVWKTRIDELLQVNGYSDAYIRINISAGIGELGLTANPYDDPTTIIFSKPLSVNGKISEKAATILKTKRNSPEGVFRLKSHHFLNNVLAKQELGNNPRREGIFLNEKGYIAEGIVSNVFWVKDRIVYTPALETGILNGVTRKFICSLLRRKQIELKEGFYEPDHLYDADEAFMTNSIQGIVPFYAVDKRHFPGNNGEITKILLNNYNKYRETLMSSKQLKKGLETDERQKTD